MGPLHPDLCGGVGDGMVFYKTAKWKNKRGKILRRDEYLCRECRRYGKLTIYPAHVQPCRSSGLTWYEFYVVLGGDSYR